MVVRATTVTMLDIGYDNTEAHQAYCAKYIFMTLHQAAQGDTVTQIELGDAHAYESLHRTIMSWDMSGSRLGLRA